MTRGSLHPEDADLVKVSPDFASSMSYWRGRYERFFSRAHNPPMRDIKATLEALAVIPDHGIDEAIKYLDRATEAHLKRAAWVSYRRSHPHPAAIPPGALAIRRVESVSGKIVSVGNVRALARLAVEIFPDEKGNPQKVSALDLQFAAALVTWWRTLHPGKPAELPPLHSYDEDLDDGGGEFLDWAWDMFVRVGRRALRGDHSTALKKITLIKTLSSAIAKADGGE